MIFKYRNSKILFYLLIVEGPEICYVFNDSQKFLPASQIHSNMDEITY